MRHILLVAMLVLLVIDWRQTLVIARNPQRWYERNPALGEHPSVARVNAWFALMAAGVLGIAWLCRGLPDVFVVFASTVVVAEVICVVNNWRLGIRIGSVL